MAGLTAMVMLIFGSALIGVAFKNGQLAIGILFLGLFLSALARALVGPVIKGIRKG